MNTKDFINIKITPTLKEQCRCMCCSDCSYYNEKIIWNDCQQRNYFYKFKVGRLL